MTPSMLYLITFDCKNDIKKQKLEYNCKNDITRCGILLHADVNNGEVLHGSPLKINGRGWRVERQRNGRGWRVEREEQKTRAGDQYLTVLLAKLLVYACVTFRVHKV